MTANSANPTVSFIVPCYGLGHLLAECVTSILSQDYSDFEILIMDDCSPDNTPEVARSFADTRVVHVRNQPNLGHLRNYNKGIRMARGEYIWLISADDRLCRNYVLDRYVRLMSENPQVGYCFCAGLAMDDHREIGLIPSSQYRLQDGIFSGRRFLLDLLKGNFILAPAGMARRECYERISYFPEDMPYGGDWYLWCVFALNFDVAYFAEPMVNYRVHDLSMSTMMAQGNRRGVLSDIMEVPVRMRLEGERIGNLAIVARCRETMIAQYAECLVAKEIRNQRLQITVAEFEESLQRFAREPGEYREIRWRVFCRAGDHACWLGELDLSAAFYWRALALKRLSLTIWLKLALLKSGNLGLRLRQLLGVLRRIVPQPHRRAD
jgi:glycosyltransferase involved in cell wall biosynthesis